MHIAQLLDPLALAPYVEVVESLLPDRLWHGFEQRNLQRVPAPPLFGQDAPRKTWLERLHYGRRIFLLRFADEQVNVLGHNHVADHHEGIAPAYLLEHFEKKIAAARRAQQGLSATATPGDKMQAAGAVVAM